MLLMSLNFLIVLFKSIYLSFCGSFSFKLFLFVFCGASRLPVGV